MSRAPKGHILFAQRVDEQLQVLLFGQVEAAMNRIKAGFAEKYRPEIEAVIGILYYYLSFSRDGPTPGMSTFGLGFHRTFPLGISWFAGCDRNDLPSAGDIPSPSPRTTDNKESERRESRGIDKYIPLFVVACIYGFRRLERQSLLGDWRREPQGSLKNRMYRLIRVLATSFQLCGIANTLMFLCHGVYPSLLHRISGVQIALPRPTLLPGSPADIRARSDGNNAMSSTGLIVAGMLASPTLLGPLMAFQPGYADSQIFLRSRQAGWSALRTAAGTLRWLGAQAYIRSDTLQRGERQARIMRLWARRGGRRAGRAVTLVSTSVTAGYSAGIARLQNGVTEGVRGVLLAIGMGSEPSTGSTGSTGSGSSSGSSSGSVLVGAGLGVENNSAMIASRLRLAALSAGGERKSDTGTNYTNTNTNGVNAQCVVLECVNCATSRGYETRPAENPVVVSNPASCAHVYCYVCFSGIRKKNEKYRQQGITAIAVDVGDQSRAYPQTQTRTQAQAQGGDQEEDTAVQPYLCPLCDSLPIDAVTYTIISRPSVHRF